MPIFIIVLDEDIPDDAVGAVTEKIEAHYPNHYDFSNRVYLVSGELTETIAENIGIKGAQQVDAATGAVFKLNGTYSGYTSPSLWEWLTEAESRK